MVGEYAQLKSRAREKKTNQNSYTEEDLNAAINLVVNENYSERQAADIKNIPHKTLNR